MSPVVEVLIQIGLALLKALSHLPRSWLGWLGRRIGGALFWLVPRRRRIAMINLRLCFPQWTEQQRIDVAREHFRLYGRSFLEAFIIWFGSEQRIRSMVSLRGIEHLNAHQGKPVIVLAPHFLGLDAGGMRFQMERHSGCIYSNQSSASLNAMLLQGRARFNNPVMLSRQEGIRPVVRMLRDGVPFHLSPDMDLGPREAVFVPFFAETAATVNSVARLAQMTGAKVVPLVTRMTDDGYIAEFHPAWPDYPGEDIAAATRQVNAFIEQQVLQQPAQYLWTHRRFKTRPPGASSVY